MEKWINFRLLEGKAILNTTTAVYLQLLSWFSTEHSVTALNSDRIKELCGQCGMSKSSFYRALRDLQNAGIITYHGGIVKIPEYDELYKQRMLPIIFKR